MSDALKPCPFCGGAAERFDLDDLPEDDPNVGASGVQCKRCGASSPLHFDRKENLDDSWNRRADLVPAQPSQAQTVVNCAIQGEAPIVADFFDAQGKVVCGVDIYPHKIVASVVGGPSDSRKQAQTDDEEALDVGVDYTITILADVLGIAPDSFSWDRHSSPSPPATIASAPPSTCPAGPRA